jgi:hypothetical protein
MKYLATVIALCLGVFSNILTAQTTTIVSQSQDFTGLNVYSPTLLYDSQENVYKMWYGGWQAASDCCHDKIYYRTSTDDINWSAPITVLTPTEVEPNGGIHVKRSLGDENL